MLKKIIRLSFYLLILNFFTNLNSMQSNPKQSVLNYIDNSITYIVHTNTTSYSKAIRDNIEQIIKTLPCINETKEELLKIYEQNSGQISTKLLDQKIFKQISLALPLVLPTVLSDYSTIKSFLQKTRTKLILFIFNLMQIRLNTEDYEHLIDTKNNTFKIILGIQPINAFLIQCQPNLKEHFDKIGIPLTLAISDLYYITQQINNTNIYLSLNLIIKILTHINITLKSISQKPISEFSKTQAEASANLVEYLIEKKDPLQINNIHQRIWFLNNNFISLDTIINNLFNENDIYLKDLTIFIKNWGNSLTSQNSSPKRQERYNNFFNACNILSLTKLKDIYDNLINNCKEMPYELIEETVNTADL